MVLPLRYVVDTDSSYDVGGERDTGIGHRIHGDIMQLQCQNDNGGEHLANATVKPAYVCRIRTFVPTSMLLDHPQQHPARSAGGRIAADVHHSFASWAAVMQHHDTAYGEKPWLIHHDARHQRSVWSYAVFIDVARRTAALLVSHGIGAGDRVVIAGHNHPDTINQYFACWMIGACAVPLNMTEDDSRLAYIMGASGARLAFVRSDYAERVATLRPDSLRTVVDVDTDTADPTYYRALRALDPLPWPSEDVDRRFDDCLLVYTSGTTGNPKGVVLVQQNLFADGYDIADWHGIDESTRMMCVLPVHHVNGTIVTHVAPFLAGASVVLCRKFSTEHFFPTIQDEAVSVVSVVPTLLAFLLEGKAQPDASRPNSLRHIICGAGPLTVELATQFETTYRIPIVHGYGLSETTCYTCFLPADLAWDEHRAWMHDHGFPSIGTPLPCNEMAIHTADGVALGAGERGEIVVRGTNVMRGYDANPTANAEAFAHGWFRSGDEGFYLLDPSGRPYYFITGRIKELIIRGGVNIAPLEIDEVLAGAPGVRAGIAVGFDNDMYGEEIGALVIPETADTDAEAILAYCQEHLPFSKAPKVVLFSDTLPVTSTGKYQRRLVKDRFAAYRGVQFKR